MGLSRLLGDREQTFNAPSTPRAKKLRLCEWAKDGKIVMFSPLLLRGIPCCVIRYHHAFAKEVGRIAIGSHRHKGIGRLMLGSTANAVLHGTPCDMLVIRVK